MKVQPAVKSYFFGKCYSDIFGTMGTIWQKSTKPIVNEWARVAGLFRKNIFAALISLICDLVVFSVITVAVLLFNSLISIALLVGFLVLALFVFVSYSVVYIIDLIFCAMKGIVTHCPNCQRKFLLPTYKCPKCGAEHTTLRPGKYGILVRKCNCGAKLPTTFFNGRQKLPAVCAYCKTNLKDGGKHRELVIPVVGGPAAGKTCFITSAIMRLETVTPNYGFNFAYSPTSGDDYLRNKAVMERSGGWPAKTSDFKLKYYQFYLTPKTEKLKNLVSLCDVAGESYESNSGIDKQIGLKNADAFIMIIDPLSVTKFREETAKTMDISSYGASKRPLDEILSVLIDTLVNMKCLTPKSSLKSSVAVVFTKCDFAAIKDKIGDKAVEKYMRDNNIQSEYEARNAVCKKFLTDYDEANFLNNLNARFKNVQFFACDAKGSVMLKGRGDYATKAVAEPVLWLYEKSV